MFPSESLSIDQPEVPDLAKIEQACALMLQKQTPAPDAQRAKSVAESLSNAKFRQAINEKGEIVGLLYYSILENQPTIHLDFLGVLEQRKGIGRFMMEDFFKFAKSMNFKEIVLEVSEQDQGAKLFYEKLGFKQTDYIEGKELNKYVMTKELE